MGKKINRHVTIGKSKQFAKKRKDRKRMQKKHAHVNKYAHKVKK